MCGFAGWVGADPEGRLPDRLLRRMGSYLAPRGPDDEVALERPAFRVVFRRLAIVDVSGGRQPFESPDRRFVAVVNGEIYNYRELRQRYLADRRFATGSDCEVVLHLFQLMGPAFLAALNGIYALAIWDTQTQTLLLARDRLGVKPLYYAATSDALLFASELKALLAHPQAPRTIDWAAFDHVPGSAFPFDRPAGRPVATGIEGVSFLAPASYAEWHAGRLGEPTTYWNPPLVGDDDGRVNDDYVDAYTELLTDAVGLQLMSDVPVGVCLSGGVDSSLITAIASRHGQVTAFTLTEPSIASTGDTAAAVRLAAELDVPIHLVSVDEEALSATLPFTLETLEYFIWMIDFPLFDVEFLFKHELHRYAKSAIPEMRVLLLGQGADEFAGGYSRLGPGTWDGFTRMEEAAVNRVRARTTKIAAPYHPYARVPNGDGQRSEAAARLAGLEPWQFLRFGDLAAYNLWHEDRTAAANGVEARVPFLDHRLVEFLCAVPLARRAELFLDKAIVRHAAMRFLSPDYARRPKVPLFPRQVGSHDSVLRLYRSLVRATFDDFSSKYLSGNGALFERTALASLRDRALGPRGAAADLHLLIRCMAISIFERLCSEVGDEAFVPPRLAARSAPLTTALAPAPPARELTAGSRIALAASVRLALSCEVSPVLLVIEDGVVTAQVTVPPIVDASVSDLFSARSFAVSDLARVFGARVEDVTSLAEAFVSRRWGVMVDAE